MAAVGRSRGPASCRRRSAIAAEATNTARQFLTICIRALDYCPPVDIQFGDYLRGLITSDAEVVENDELGCRKR